VPVEAGGERVAAGQGGADAGAGHVEVIA